MTRILPNGDLIDFNGNRVWINGIDNGEMNPNKVKELFKNSREFSGDLSG